MYVLYIDNYHTRCTADIAERACVWCNECCWIVPGTVED